MKHDILMAVTWEKHFIVLQWRSTLKKKQCLTSTTSYSYHDIYSNSFYSMNITSVMANDSVNNVLYLHWNTYQTTWDIVHAIAMAIKAWQNNTLTFCWNNDYVSSMSCKQGEKKSYINNIIKGCRNMKQIQSTQSDNEQDIFYTYIEVYIYIKVFIGKYIIFLQLFF